MSDFDDLLEQLPSLSELLVKHGSMSLFDYAQKYYSVSDQTSPLFLSRKQEFLDFLEVYVSHKFDRSLAGIVVKTLQSNYAVSTAEHHGPMGHPFFFQSALLRALAQPELPVVNFATSHVSLGNSSYPRGLIFHGDWEKSPIEYLHLPFFWSKTRMSPVYQFPSYTRWDIDRNCIERLKAYRRDNYITESLYNKIYDFIQEHVLNSSILALSTYSEQITILNNSWWKKLFPHLPEYISLDAEDMVVQLLLKHLQEDTIFTRILTDVSLQPIIEDQFDGISCCFSLKEKRWTYLFWYLDENHHRHALWREDDELVSEGGDVRIKMNAKDLTYFLAHKRLVPSWLLVYSILNCYYGVMCFGGFSQGDYLPSMQRVFQKLDVLCEAFTTWIVLNEDLVFILEKDGKVSTALDVYWKWTNDIPFRTIHTTTLLDSLNQMQDEIVRCL